MKSGSQIVGSGSQEILTSGPADHIMGFSDPGSGKKTGKQKE